MAPALSATDAAETASKSRKRIRPPCWHRRSCRRARPAAPDWAARSGWHRHPTTARGGVLRPGSCGGAPCKVAERVVQGTMHATRIFRGQNSLPPGFKTARRRAADLRRHVQRPAEMFAGVTKTDAQAVVADDVIIQRADISELIGERWRRLGDSALQTPSDLARQPGFSLRAAADHHGIRPRPFKRRHRL